MLGSDDLLCLPSSHLVSHGVRTVHCTISVPSSHFGGILVVHIPRCIEFFVFRFTVESRVEFFSMCSISRLRVNMHRSQQRVSQSMDFQNCSSCRARGRRPMTWNWRSMPHMPRWKWRTPEGGTSRVCDSIVLSTRSTWVTLKSSKLRLSRFVSPVLDSPVHSAHLPVCGGVSDSMISVIAH